MADDPAAKAEAPEPSEPDLDAVTRLLGGLVGGDPDGDLAARINRFAVAGHSVLGEALGRVRGELTRLRRREHELTVLFSSARDLAESRDLDILLTKLVTRAHELMGTDITYLSEFHPATRELRVRKAVGSVTHEFQNLRVPPDKGLASRVASSRAAQWTSRYTDYSGGPHDAEIDDAVRAEGIVSILGVPMLAEEMVLGVLFAATRHERAFSAEEIALLSALADHASVIIQTARILERLRESEQSTQRALASLREHVAARDRSNIVHQSLVQAVLAGKGFHTVAETVAEALGRAVSIIDDDANVVATAGDISGFRPQDYCSPPVQAAVETSCETGHCCVVADDRSRVESVAAITVGTQYYGALLLGRGDLTLGPVDERTIERAAQVCSLMTLQQNAAADADRRTRAELVADLVDTAPHRRRDLARRLRNHGITLSELDTVITVVVDADRRAAATRFLAGYLPATALVAEVEGMVAAVTSAPAPSRLAASIREKLADHLGGPVLVICPPASAFPEDLPAAFSTTLRTARLLDALGVTDAAVDTSEYELFAVLFGHDPEAIHRFVAATLGPVLDYDAAHGTDLTSTLAAFVRNGASPTRTARSTSYHANTILQRLDRIGLLLGEHWRTDEQLYRISTAVRLEELRRTARDG